ncbi:YfcE family phosphodiesterase [Entomospira entomophila]|uniref:Phosphoesterase n=1 Tax=Entomospira entomophila TaxID=2719988 RepID=A0A968G7A8_9SPIO|nr:YfcE family phosphodiesterase [Entomospira entomophilus]NIZ39935.1 YfcE family phosphodiesterase [Entomospira entomophilus]WDI35496.1 YfcE family phosphodiesterase [Entomospira entomophilus]
MKILFFSDLHGQIDQLQTLLKKQDAMSADWILNCGDFFGGYSPQEAITQELSRLYLSNPAQKLSVLGNNDSSTLLSLISNQPYAQSIVQTIGDIHITMTHGHLGSAEMFLGEQPKTPWRLFIEGHTHVARLKKVGTSLYLNPGSLSYPRSQLPPTYAILKEKTLSVKALENDRVFHSEILD